MANNFFDSSPNIIPSVPSPEESVRAVLSPETQRLYVNPRTLIWVNKPNLFENLRAVAAAHGIHDTFADSTTIHRLLASRNTTDRAMADRLMTESVMRTAKEVSSRRDVGDFAQTFSIAMAPRNNPQHAASVIQNALDGISPQHPFYQDMRNQYQQRLIANPNDPKLTSLAVNMARVRQEGIHDTPLQNQILVNVAAGTMRYDIAGTQGSSRVIIGAGQVEIPNSQTGVMETHNKSTPIGEGGVHSVNLHEPWRPTINIARRRGLMDQIPHLLASGADHYIEPNGTRFEFDRNLVNNPNVSPFMMRAGPNNPMGAIKVSLGGTFGRSNIYIHDTPDTADAFQNFAQSSGCMRTQGITQLAAALTRDPDLGARYGYGSNQALFDAAKETTVNPQTGQTEMRNPMNGLRVPIHNGVRVKTEYKTVTWNPQTQQAEIHPDIYKRDGASQRPSVYAMPILPLDIQDTPAQVAQQTLPRQTHTPRYPG
jgi:lipoprotein-anchoring transpeptidase ErfK/SrfK